MTNEEREQLAADEREILKGMCRECADELARWSRAFAAQHEPILAELVEGLRDHILKRAALIAP